MPINVDLIIAEIQTLSLKDALAYLIAKGIYDYSKNGYYKIKQIIINKQNEGKYAFFPNKEETQKLLEIGHISKYRALYAIVPNYRYIDLLRTGFLIDEYHKNDNEINRQRVKAIKCQISNRPNSRYFLKLVNLPTTEFFNIIINYLQNMKYKGYGDNFLEEKFEEIVNEWRKTSRFVENKDKSEDVYSFCYAQIKNKENPFFLLGMKNKVVGTIRAGIKKLIKSDIFEKNKYRYFEKLTTEGNHPRLEVTFFED